VALANVAEDIQILANPDQLRQVFWNLAQNGIRAMPRGGTLTIVAEPSADGWATITFRDEGVGMTGDQKARLFQPFHAGFAGGTGLGLSIVYQIVKDHGGKILVASESGKGTSVILQFPPLGETSISSEEITENAFSTPGR
jgi:signal transduction histidine kinase